MTVQDGGELLPIPEDIKFDYQGRCWWCGAPADSREHKYKKSDIVREFGAGPWPGKSALVRVQEGSPHFNRATGPNSSLFKFSKVLCQKCNNERSQPFDYAYEELSQYLFAREDEILQRGHFVLSDVYGRAWRPHRDSALRYFIKHIGCRLAEDGVEVPPSFVRFLDGTLRAPRGLSLTLGLRLDIIAAENHMWREHNIPPGSLWLGPSHATYSPSVRKLKELQSHVGVGGVRIAYLIKFDGGGYKTNLRRNSVKLDIGSNVNPDSILQICLECNPLGRQDI